MAIAAVAEPPHEGERQRQDERAITPGAPQIAIDRHRDNAVQTPPPRTAPDRIEGKRLNTTAIGRAAIVRRSLRFFRQAANHQPATLRPARTPRTPAPDGKQSVP